MGAEMLAAISTAVGLVQTDVMSILSTVGPIAIAIIGVFLAWKLGIRFFKGLVR